MPVLNWPARCRFWQMDWEAPVGVACRIDWEDTTQPGAQRAVVVDVATCNYLPAGSMPLQPGPVLERSPNDPRPSG